MTERDINLVTDREGVRDFRGMRREYRQREGLVAPANPETGGSRPVVVTFSEVVDPADLEPKLCRVVKLLNSNWVPTGATLRVRNLTLATIAPDVAQVAIPNVGLLGYGVIGGGGGGGCDSCCVSIDYGDLVHPHLPSGKNDTVAVWPLSGICGGPLEPITIPNSGGTGSTVWAGGEPSLVYEATGHTFTADVSADCIVLDNTGTDVTNDAGVTKSGSVVMDWSATPRPTIVVSLESTIP